MVATNTEIVLALDGLEPRMAMDLCRKIGRDVYAVKIHELFDQLNCQAIELLRQVGVGRVWIDYKLHDIPATVAKRAAALRDAGADILSVHASGGEEMMKAAVENGPPEIFAITVLTSLDPYACACTYGRMPDIVVMQLGLMAASAGVHGVVCSPQEVAMLSNMQKTGQLKLVVPGVRSVGVDAGDQRRIGTPGQAAADGASLLVVGRQLTTAPDPILELARIKTEIATARNGG